MSDYDADAAARPPGALRSYLAAGKWRFFALAGGLLVLDQVTKLVAVRALELARSVSVLPFFDLTLVHNTGAAFSLMSDAAGWQRWVLLALALAVGAVLVVWIGRARPDQKALMLALSLILAGALGNAVDRLAHGYVIDFIDLHAAGWHWPAFNVADSAITVGVTLFAILTLLGKDR